MTKGSGTQLISRAFRLLRLFDHQHVEMSLSKLAEKAELHPTTAYRILQALMNEDFLIQNPETTRYSLGFGLIKIGELAKRSNNLIKIAMPYAKVLAEKTGEGVTVELLNRNMQVDAVLFLPSPYRLGGQPKYDHPAPAYCTATGKVQLAYLSTRKIDEYFLRDLPRLTPMTIVDTDELREELQTIREQGYATNLEELEPGLVATAAPIWDLHGHVIAGISVGGPITRLTEDILSGISDEVIRAAAAISKDLGFQS